MTTFGGVERAKERVRERWVDLQEHRASSEDDDGKCAFATRSEWRRLDRAPLSACVNCKYRAKDCRAFHGHVWKDHSIALSDDEVSSAAPATLPANPVHDRPARCDEGDNGTAAARNSAGRDPNARTMRYRAAHAHPGDFADYLPKRARAK